MIGPMIFNTCLSWLFAFVRWKSNGSRDFSTAGLRDFCTIPSLHRNRGGQQRAPKKPQRVLVDDIASTIYVVDMTLDTRDLRRNNGVVIDNEEVDASILTDARSEILIRGRILQRRDSEDCYII